MAKARQAVVTKLQSLPRRFPRWGAVLAAGATTILGGLAAGQWLGPSAIPLGLGLGMIVVGAAAALQQPRRLPDTTGQLSALQARMGEGGSRGHRRRQDQSPAPSRRGSDAPIVVTADLGASSGGDG